MNKITTGKYMIRIAVIHRVKLFKYWRGCRINGPFWRLYRNDSDGASLRDDRGRETALKSGKFYLLAPDCNLAASCRSQDVNQFFIHFEVDQLGGNSDFRINELPDCNYISELYEKVVNSSSTTPGRILSATALVSAALALLPEKALNTLERDVEMSRIAEYMREHLASPLAVPDLARRANLSENQFVRRFSAAIGCPPYRYLVNLRYSRGAAMLEAGNNTIDEIIAAVGINDRGHFSRNFKMIYGISPAAYRRSFRSNSTLSKFDFHKILKKGETL